MADGESVCDDRSEPDRDDSDDADGRSAIGDHARMPWLVTDNVTLYVAYAGLPQGDLQTSAFVHRSKLYMYIVMMFDVNDV